MLRTFRLALFALVSALLVTLLLGAGAASAQTTVNVTMTDPAVPGSAFDLTASATSAPEGDVTFEISNDGGGDHDFVVIRTDLPVDQLPIDPITNSVDLTQVDVAGSTPVIAGGGSDTLTLNLSAGNYILLCNVPGHWSNMNASFQVTGGTTPTTPATQPTGGTPAASTTPSATAQVTGLGDTGGGQGAGSGGNAWWALTALAAAGAAFVAMGALTLRKAR